MNRQERYEARYAEYCRLRDEGLRPWDAAREIGVERSTGDKYERSYRQARGLPPVRSRYYVGPTNDGRVNL